MGLEGVPTSLSNLSCVHALVPPLQSKGMGKKTCVMTREHRATGWSIESVYGFH